MRRISLFILTLACTSALFASKVKTVEGTYDYVVPETVSRADAKRIAEERAMIQALADEFGTIISSEVWTEVKNDNGESTTGLWSLGNSLVKGEWLETIGTPVIETFTQDDMMVIRATVKGKARAIESAGIDLQVMLLRNGTDERFQADRFINNDNLFLLFKSPVKGFLTVYLTDDLGNAFRMLPFRQQSEGAYTIEADREYLFFNSQEGSSDRYRLYTNKTLERNAVYVIFSPNEYVRPLDKQAGELVPRTLNFDDFTKWLSKIRIRDPKMQVVVKPITIVPKG